MPSKTDHDNHRKMQKYNFSDISSPTKAATASLRLIKYLSAFPSSDPHQVA